MTDLAEIAERATPIELREPLGELLGSVEPGGVVRFTLVDVGKLAGHLCPTVTTAFELTRRALKGRSACGLPRRRTRSRTGPLGA